ncbi:ESPR domain-containing protein [Caviibacterium pharyngocola]|uniref:ESPR domain-containing protein n=1 Tax=Caviibacterium pharyngocola TaxID=28159 RepID=A0A2M8RWN0_9PAST|nr:ESPR domain-containing protein [Caviibacterium pharyngocola]PJG83283.1 hypothetical protein CVP04_04905 [Caviibacterium pharyngocola]
MNNIFKVIWNAATKQLVVVSELARGKVKSSSNNQTAVTKTVLKAGYGVLFGALLTAGALSFSASAQVTNYGNNNSINGDCNNMGNLVVFGHNNTPNPQSCVGGIFGSNSTIDWDALGSYVIGNNSTASAKDMVLIGNNIKPSNGNGLVGAVILGTNSTGYSVQDTNSLGSVTINGHVYENFAGGISSMGSFVSVGGTGTNEQRLIVNVAPGKLSATSTEAINGSQLYAVASKLQADITSGGTTSTYKFNIANSQSAGTATTGKQWSSDTASNEITFGATSDLKVTADASGNIIYGLSDTTSAAITDAKNAAKTVTDSLTEINNAVSQAASHANAAASSASAASTSATNAANAATRAATSATKASSSASAAESSATLAGNSATAAATSASDAAVSATTAASSATDAANSATSAASSATDAANSASDAAASAAKAKTSETNAKASETAAAGSASDAATSAANAKTSETNAKT